ncbi:MAG TPA: JAB domain-containing protein, partial [Nitrospiraceae bacterium]|nr:JAB domain-containing protein [Nitrospiraceae bacterium]
MPIDGPDSLLSSDRQSDSRRRYGIPRYRVALVREGRAVPASGTIQTSIGADALFRPLLTGLDREHFVVCGLDAKHAAIGMNLVSVGTLTLALVHPREVFKPLLLMNAGACL